jgi:hypothetical protein
MVVPGGTTLMLNVAPSALRRNGVGAECSALGYWGARTYGYAGIDVLNEQGVSKGIVELELELALHEFWHMC